MARGIDPEQDLAIAVIRQARREWSRKKTADWLRTPIGRFWLECASDHPFDEDWLETLCKRLAA